MSKFKPELTKIQAAGPDSPTDNQLAETYMLLDVRTYTCRPGTIGKHLALYEKLGKEPQTRHLGQPLALW